MDDFADRAPPELAPQMLHLASLRSELRALRGALAEQRPRMEASNRIMLETQAIRSAPCRPRPPPRAPELAGDVDNWT